MPRWLVIENELKEMKIKIQKYMDHNLCIPTEYADKYNRLLEEFKNLPNN